MGNCWRPWLIAFNIHISFVWQVMHHDSSSVTAPHHVGLWLLIWWGTGTSGNDAFRGRSQPRKQVRTCEVTLWDDSNGVEEQWMDDKDCCLDREILKPTKQLKICKREWDQNTTNLVLLKICDCLWIDATKFRRVWGKSKGCKSDFPGVCHTALTVPGPKVPTHFGSCAEFWEYSSHSRLICREITKMCDLTRMWRSLWPTYRVEAFNNRSSVVQRPANPENRFRQKSSFIYDFPWKGRTIFVSTQLKN